MKRLFAILVLVLTLTTANAYACPVTVTQSYSIDYNMFNYQPYTFSLILHAFSDDNLGQADQTDTINLNAGPITSAEIALTHLNNQPNSWYLKSGAEMIGYLSPSQYNWVTDNWSLDQSILNSMMGTGHLNVSFWNDSDEVAILAVDILNATVENTINPVPEPATLLLFGSGLIGLTFPMRKRIFATVKIKK